MIIERHDNMLASRSNAIVDGRLLGWVHEHYDRCQIVVDNGITMGTTIGFAKDRDEAWMILVAYLVQHLGETP